jgi:hypothetical protein
MPSMLSYNRRLPSGHFTCYLNRTYHVLTTRFDLGIDKCKLVGVASRCSLI